MLIVPPTGNQAASAMSAVDAIETALKVISFIKREFANASSLDSHCKEIGKR